MLHFGKIPKKFGQIWRKFSKILAKLRNFGKKTAKNSAIFNENFEIRERCKGVHCVDLGESFPTSIYLQKSASIQPRTSPSKFGGKYSLLFTGVLSSTRMFVATRTCGQASPAPKGAQCWTSRFSMKSQRYHFPNFEKCWSIFR